MHFQNLKSNLGESETTFFEKTRHTMVKKHEKTHWKRREVKSKSKKVFFDAPQSTQSRSYAWICWPQLPTGHQKEASKHLEASKCTENPNLRATDPGESPKTKLLFLLWNETSSRKGSLNRMNFWFLKGSPEASTDPPPTWANPSYEPSLPLWILCPKVDSISSTLHSSEPYM